ncbi:response regulator [Undibacterium sp. Jales W-56]|uniref:response regulator n=1 Tax=Undibacterium sp. Jales W-56 TaxID=2897325 RepID=UPI0021D08146|nr:response regulator [Undibacterium sp. Jales W-56]MCU6433524.1 response regulator [Undibacterium sp. Jales W-56]
MRRALLVDDEINVLHALQRSLRPIAQKLNFDIELCNDPRLAIQKLAAAQYDFIISDYHMPSMNGVDFFRIAKEIQGDAIRMMLSASADFKTIMGAVNEAEVFRYITKPWETADLEENVRLALELREQLQYDKQVLDQAQAERERLTPEELEKKRLEESEPGITNVIWDARGGVLLDNTDDLSGK